MALKQILKMKCLQSAREPLLTSQAPRAFGTTAGEAVVPAELPGHARVVRVSRRALTLKSRFSDVDLPWEIPAAITEPE